MQAQKERIRQGFQRAKPTYAQNAKVQQTMQQKLLAILRKHCKTRNLGNILELGCGNGLLARNLALSFEFESYLAVDLVDFSNDFIKIQKDIPHKIDFLQADFEDLAQISNKNPNLQYDLILSNASMQWVNQRGFLPQLSVLLRPNGILAFSTFGAENYQELRASCGIGLEYLEPKDYAEILQSDFKILESFEARIPLHFSNTLALFRHLRDTGVNSLQQGFRLNKKFLTDYATRFHNVLTYHPIYLLAQKRSLESKPKDSPSNS
ncbi:malonyl-ACP O-methyltransferase BioC [uncultured Helicobacter sp.]|uniref:malonyl-ACP O-methyltransferase BioC n=1 Tax=uncultured Helicobacter sp. TaxID=175537 RepID=UPI0026227240|nr:malonyl-ACP O-methyltransferase BioC [uncultured Helicobacter sp.]